MFLVDFLKTLLYGVVEGITEWLPVSSTGHLILLENWLPLAQGDAFFSLFLVIIQFGAILAVVFTFFSELWPFAKAGSDHAIGRGILTVDRNKADLWAKILVACVPAAVIGLLLDNWIEANLYHHVTVAVMLIVVGIIFIVVERRNADRRPTVLRIAGITYRHAVIIGLFQVVAAVLPGTSRSGATILGGILIGLSRPVAAKFTFFLAVPVMLGASLLRMYKVGLAFSLEQWALLLLGTVTAFVVSMFAIRFLLSFVRRRNFIPFAWYRIALGLIVLAVYFISR
jgi:undecaprenyl-diphosphatase